MLLLSDSSLLVRLIDDIWIALSYHVLNFIFFPNGIYCRNSRSMFINLKKTIDINFNILFTHFYFKFLFNLYSVVCYERLNN